jgi:hypothetical protein
MDSPKTIIATPKENVCNDLKVINVNKLKELALGTKAWNDLAEKAKTHKGL